MHPSPEAYKHGLGDRYSFLCFLPTNMRLRLFFREETNYPSSPYWPFPSLPSFLPFFRPKYLPCKYTRDTIMLYVKYIMLSRQTWFFCVSYITVQGDTLLYSISYHQLQAVLNTFKIQEEHVTGAI